MLDQSPGITGSIGDQRLVLWPDDRKTISGGAYAWAGISAACLPLVPGAHADGSMQRGRPRQWRPAMSRLPRQRFVQGRIPLAGQTHRRSPHDSTIMNWGI